VNSEKQKENVPAAAVNYGGPLDGLRLDARYAGKNILALGAHPDDLELGVGGTLARLSRTANVLMAVVCVPTELPTRLREAERSAAILGCDLRVLVRDSCKRVEDLKTYEVVELFDRLIRKLKPALVLSHCASDHHKDHTMVFNACLSSQRISSFDLFCYSPTSTRPVNVDFSPSAFVDISTTIDVKMDAIAAHESQFAARGLPIEFFREHARDHGRVAGVDYAEGLEVGRIMLI
jgi:N-acetylglucosamine malate deacetylase 1